MIIEVQAQNTISNIKRVQFFGQVNQYFWFCPLLRDNSNGAVRRYCPSSATTRNSG